MCPYSELFWSAFAPTRTKVRISPSQSECGKMRNRVTPNTDTFYAVNLCDSTLRLGGCLVTIF